MRNSEKCLSRLINEAVRCAMNEMYNDGYENIPLANIFNVSAYDDLCREKIYNRNGEYA